MAKSKKKSSKPAAKSSAKPKSKAAKGAKLAKKPAAKRGSSLAPRPVNTGSGPTPMEIGRALVEAFNKGRGDEHISRIWDKGIISIEGAGVSLAWHGRKAVEAKNESWTKDHTLLGASAEGPFVGATGFAIRFKIHVRDNITLVENQMEEVGVYTVMHGRIVREEFMYASM